MLHKLNHAYSGYESAFRVSIFHCKEVCVATIGDTMQGVSPIGARFFLTNVKLFGGRIWNEKFGQYCWQCFWHCASRLGLPRAICSAAMRAKAATTAMIRPLSLRAIPMRTPRRPAIPMRVHLPLMKTPVRVCSLHLGLNMVVVTTTHMPWLASVVVLIVILLSPPSIMVCPLQALGMMRSVIAAALQASRSPQVSQALEIMRSLVAVILQASRSPTALPTLELERFIIPHIIMTKVIGKMTSYILASIWLRHAIPFQARTPSKAEQRW